MIFQFKTKNLHDKVWRGSRNPKYLVEVLDASTDDPIKPPSYTVNNKENYNIGRYFYDRKTDVILFKSVKKGGYRRKDCLLLFDRDYSDEDHLEIHIFDFVYTSPSIGFMKKICSTIDDIPVFQFHIDFEHFLVDIT